MNDQPIDIRDLKATLEKSINQKRARLAQLIHDCDPPPRDVQGLLNWLVAQVMNMKTQDVMNQVLGQAHVSAREGQDLDQAYEAEMRKAIEAFMLILNTKKPKAKIAVAHKMPPVMPASGARQ